jgi:GNAT superfamily N-acetyltransferase
LDADAEALAELLEASPQAGRMVLAQDRRADPFARRRCHPQAETVVADGDDGLAGTVTVAAKRVRVGGRDTTAAYVFDLAVAPAARGAGLASTLLAHTEGWAREQAAGLLYAWVMSGNHPAERAFSRAGYTLRATGVARVFPAFRARHDLPAPARAATGWDDGDWAAAAHLVAGGTQRLDLAPALPPGDGDALRDTWRRLPGFRPEDCWSTGRAVLGLWDHAAVARSVPVRLPHAVALLAAVGRAAAAVRLPFPAPPRLGAPLRNGYVLAGAGDIGGVQSLLQAALGRARERGINQVVVFHDRRARPDWARGAFNVTGAYGLVAKPLANGPIETVGARPVWSDPADM